MQATASFYLRKERAVYTKQKGILKQLASKNL
jgi:hypothetical protein